MSAERMVVVLLYGPWARQVRKEGSRQDDGRLISTQIRRVKRFCLLCVFGLIISKLDPTRSLTVTVRTRMAAPQMPRFDSDAIVAFAMGMFGWELRSGIHRCERRGHVVQVARRF